MIGFLYEFRRNDTREARDVGIDPGDVVHPPQVRVRHACDAYEVGMPVPRAATMDNLSAHAAPRR